MTNMNHWQTQIGCPKKVKDASNYYFLQLSPFQSSEVQTGSQTWRTGSAGSGWLFRKSGQRTGPNKTSET